MTESSKSESEIPELGAHPAGVRWALQLFVALALVGALPYLLLGLSASLTDFVRSNYEGERQKELLAAVDSAKETLRELRPWQPGGKMPFTGLFEFTPPTRSKLAGVRRKRAKTSDDDDELLAHAPLPEAEKQTEERVGSGYKSTSQQSGEYEELRISPQAYAGMTKAIEDGTDALHPFYRKLVRVDEGEQKAIARMFVYSDSVNGSDRVSSALRHKLQARFGKAGKGWVHMAPGWEYQHHQDVRWRQEKRWHTWVVNRGKGPGDRYGYGGVLASNVSPGASSFFATATADEDRSGRKVSLYRIFYQAWPGGGDVHLHLDGEKKATIDTHAEQVEDRTYELDVDDGRHELEVEVPEPKSARMYGVVMERDGPGVVVDGLALIGAFTRVLLKWNEEHWQQQLRERNPDLMIFWLGGNDTTSDSVPLIYDELVADYSGVIQRAKEALPEASCLVMGVMDAEEKRHGHWRTRRDVARAVKAGREVARGEGCAFFNTFEAVGGHGTMRRWYHASPRLAASDHHHMTEAGARVVGSLVYKALLKDYDDFLASGGD